tara:strand:- start:12145 stop:12504 length:360 start_codon:yes stop_codon:yes gene_type:complete
MASVSITFANKINDSVQTGDMIMYSNPTTVGGFSTSSQSDVVLLGACTSIHSNRLSMVVSFNNVTTLPPTTNSFILFSKDKIVNPSGVLGYYAEVCFRNNSTVESELFGVNADIFESSK